MRSGDKRNHAAGDVEPPPSSDMIVPTANEGLIAPNRFASQRCDPPPCYHPPICLFGASEQILPQGDVLPLSLSPLLPQTATSRFVIPPSYWELGKVQSEQLPKSRFVSEETCLFSCGSSARMKQVVSWGLFVKHHKGSSCHKTRKAPVCCFYQWVYHMAPSTGDQHSQLRNER